MPTSISPLTAENIIKANSGAYYLLHQDGGYTGKLNLTGPARIDNLNAGNAYVAGVLNVTGSQANFGNFTGFNFNHLARIVNTGDAYLRSVTGIATFNQIVATGRTRIDQIWDGLNISGDLGLVGDARMTGAINITGSLFINGEQITRNGSIAGTGDFETLFDNRGDILVGSGLNQYGLFTTGGAFSGQSLIYDPSLSIPFRWASGSSSSNGLVGFREGNNKVGGSLNTSWLISTGQNTNAGIAFNGTGNIILGISGGITPLSSSNCLFFGNGHVGNPTVANSAFFGSSNQGANATGALAFGSYASLSRSNELAQGAGQFLGGGRAQSSVYAFSATTTGIAESLGTIPLEGGQALSLKCLVVAAEDYGGSIGECAGYELSTIYKNDAGTISMIGSQSKTILGEEDASYDISTEVGVDSINILVSGDALNNTKWMARVETAFISF